MFASLTRMVPASRNAYPAGDGVQDGNSPTTRFGSNVMKDSPTSVVVRRVPDASDHLGIGALVDEMILGWHTGARPSAEDFFYRRPELLQHPEAAMRLLYEEICQRAEHGECIDTVAILQRYPQWRDELKVLLAYHSSAQEQNAPAPPWPRAGHVLGEYYLVNELGDGAQGRVYLALQPQLANRPVVLKLSRCVGQEHLSLARLQHTHIVPLYAVHNDVARNQRTLCMPYFGGATLRQIQDALKAVPVKDRTGQRILDAIDASQREASAGRSVPVRSTGPARDFLKRATYTEAICWIGACLADALHYAHERGLVHLDLKPSNVLIAGDGQPMLLDFHLAQQPLLPYGEVRDWLGGTPLYMSPEQEAALEATSLGQPLTAAVDHRSDIYALALVLYEALGGPRTHVRTPARGRALRQANPKVSVGLADILDKCLQAEATRRYAHAGALAVDLKRHLHHLPLRGVRNRSLRERWQKWRRRSPHALGMGIMAAAVVTGTLALGAAWWNQRAQQHQAAENALADARRAFEKAHFAQAVDILQRGLVLTQFLPANTALADVLRQELKRAQHAHAREQLHQLSDRFRFLSGAAPPSQAEFAQLRTLWSTAWLKRTWLLSGPGAVPGANPDPMVRADLLDLGIIWADLLLRCGDITDQACREAAHVLDETETLCGPSPVLALQRRQCAAALGKPAPPAQDPDVPPRSAWEYSALGRFYLQHGDAKKAASLLERATAMQPGGFWPHFLRGLTALRLQRHEEAVSAFTVCIALKPEAAEGYFNRGLAFTGAGKKEAALEDYQRALELQPELAAAALNRGLLHLELKNYGAAVKELHRALESGGDPARIHYNLALTYLAQKNHPAALASLRRALDANPHHRAAKDLLELMRK